MIAEATCESQEINTFEEYTLYSLDQSLSGVFGMMQRSKQVARAWPDVSAMVGMADLCKEVAALACFQNSLCETLGPIDDDEDACWPTAVKTLQGVMETLDSALTEPEDDFVKRVFGMDLPASLNQFAESIPLLKRHVESMISTESVTLD